MTSHISFGPRRKRSRPEVRNEARTGSYLTRRCGRRSYSLGSRIKPNPARIRRQELPSNGDRLPIRGSRSRVTRELVPNPPTCRARLDPGTPPGLGSRKGRTKEPARVARRTNERRACVRTIPDRIRKQLILSPPLRESSNRIRTSEAGVRLLWLLRSAFLISDIPGNTRRVPFFARVKNHDAERSYGT